MIALIIFMMCVGLFAIIGATVILKDNTGGEPAAIVLIIIGLAVIAVSLVKLNDHIEKETTMAVKDTVLKTLTYTNHTTLVPKDNEFYYRLDDSTVVILFDYLTEEDE